MTTAGARRVTVFKLEVLPASETFVRNQIDALTRWNPTLVGSVSVPSGLRRPTDRVVFTRSVPDRARLWWAAAGGRSRRVHAALAATRPDLVHVHFGKDAAMVVRAVRRLGVPLVVTVHGYDVSAVPAARGLGGWVARHRLRRTLSDADAVVAVSDFIAARAVACGADPACVRVLPIGIPLPPLVTRGSPVRVRWDVLFVGRFVPKKGVADLVEALARISRVRSVRCCFIGDGPDRAAIEVLARRAGVDAHFLGTAAPSVVREHLLTASVFAAPSRTAPDGDVEGLGMVFLEAAAAGTPAVAYRHGGVPEAVIDGVTGLLVDEGDVDALTCALARLIENTALRRRLGSQAQARVYREFDIVTRTAALERLYDGLIEPDLRVRAGRSPESAPPTDR